MKKNIGVALALVAIGFAFGVGLKLLAWVLVAIAVALATAYVLTRGGSLGEDDIEEVFPDPPARAPEARHEWRNTSAKAPHAD